MSMSEHVQPSIHLQEVGQLLHTKQDATSAPCNAHVESVQDVVVSKGVQSLNSHPKQSHHNTHRIRYVAVAVVGVGVVVALICWLVTRTAGVSEASPIGDPTTSPTVLGRDSIPSTKYNCVCSAAHPHCSPSDGYCYDQPGSNMPSNTWCTGSCTANHACLSSFGEIIRLVFQVI